MRPFRPNKTVRTRLVNGFAAILFLLALFAGFWFEIAGVCPKLGALRLGETYPVIGPQWDGIYVEWVVAGLVSDGPPENAESAATIGATVLPGGKVIYEYADPSYPARQWAIEEWRHSLPATNGHWWAGLWVHDSPHVIVVNGRYVAHGFVRRLRIDHAIVAAVLCILPAWRLLRGWRNLGRARRLRAGLCPECGYDVRTSPRRCPECGTVLNALPQSARGRTAQ